MISTSEQLAHIMGILNKKLEAPEDEEANEPEKIENKKSPDQTTEEVRERFTNNPNLAKIHCVF